MFTSLRHWRRRAAGRPRRYRLDLEMLENRTTPSDVSGSISAPGEVDVFAINVSYPGYLRAEVTPSNGLTPRLELYSSESILSYRKGISTPVPIGGGGLLVGSVDRGDVGDARPLIPRFYLLPAQYYLAVSAPNTGSYTLSLQVTPDQNNPFAAETVQSRLQVGADPRSLVTADFNRDGLLDLASANHGDGTVSVLLGVGDNTFQPQIKYSVGGHPGALAANDVNGDGRLDLLVRDQGIGTVSVLWGVGDGTFLSGEQNQDPRLAGLFSDPIAILPHTTVSVPLDIQDHLDIHDIKVLLNIEYPHDADLTVTLRSPAGTCRTLFSQVGAWASDFTNVVLEDQAYSRIDLLPSRADGTLLAWPYDGVLLQPQESLLDNGGFKNQNAGGQWRLEITNRGSDSGWLRNWSLYFNNSSFVTNFPTTVVLGDFNRDGDPDEIYGKLVQQGQPIYENHLSLAGGTTIVADTVLDITRAYWYYGNQRYWWDNAGMHYGPSGIANQNFNCYAFLKWWDGGRDLYPIQEAYPQQNPLLMGGIFPSNPTRSTPLLGDLTGDGITDVLVLDRSGDIFLRRGLAGGLGTFGPAEKINDDPRWPGARDVAILSTGRDPRIAAIDLGGDSLSIYTFDGHTWQRRSTLETGLGPFHLAVGDLDRDGLPDIVVSNLGLGSVSIFHANDKGGFDVLPQVRVDTNTALVLEDVNKDDYLDLVMTEVNSSTVNVRYNQKAARGTITFGPQQRYRAGANNDLTPYGVGIGASNIVNGICRDLFAAYGFPRVDGFPNQYSLYSFHETRDVAVCDFTSDGVNDLVCVNYASDTVTLLRGKRDGSFVDPRSFATGHHPLLVGTGRFRNGMLGDSAVLAILCEGDHTTPATIHIYRNDGPGGIVECQVLPAGDEPTGLTVADVTAPGGGKPDGWLDLLIGNQYGDLLVLPGNGDGTFRPYVQTEARVPFILTDLSRAGVPRDVVLANQVRDQAQAQLRIPGTHSFVPGSFQQNASNGLIAPGAVAEANLDGDPYGTDLIFANSGSNNVLVYLRQPDGSFAKTPRSFFAGTNPIALQVADLNHDSLPDLLVANQGSNDVSILYGSKGPDGKSPWTFEYGPRLQTGGRGVNSVTLQDLNRDGIPDLVATNGQDGTVSTIPGIARNGASSGFFDDSHVTTIRVAPGPIVQTKILGPNALFVRTQSDRIYLSNSTTGWTDLGAGKTFDVLPVAGHFPVVVIAQGDGSASLLASEDGRNYSKQAVVHLPTSGTPSALEILQIGSGVYDVYLTNTGSSQPIVLTFDLRTELTPVGPSLALAATLLTGLPVEAVPQELIQPTVEAFVPLWEVSEGAIVALNGATALPGGAEAEEDNPDVPSASLAGGEGKELPAVHEFLSGQHELLEKLTDRDRGMGRIPQAEELPPPKAPATPLWLDGLLEQLKKLLGQVPRSVSDCDVPSDVAFADRLPPDTLAALFQTSVPARSKVGQAALMVDQVFGEAEPFMTWSPSRGLDERTMAGVLASTFLTAGLLAQRTHRDGPVIAPRKPGGRKARSG